MKSAIKWADELFTARSLSLELAPTIRKIQAEALATAADICIRLHTNSDKEDCAAAILAEADKLDDSPPNNTSSFGNPALER